VALAGAVGAYGFVAGTSSVGATEARPDRSAACSGSTSRQLLARHLAALNRGDSKAIARTVAPASAFTRYLVVGSTGTAVRATRPAKLFSELRQRHAHHEQLHLQRVTQVVPGRDSFSLRFEVARSSDDAPLPAIYIGITTVRCGTGAGISSWVLTPNPEPRLPAPESFADTCAFTAAWCDITRPIGGVSDELRRPLRLPQLKPGDPCPRTSGVTFANGQWGGVALGTGPVQPLLATGLPGTPESMGGVVRIAPYNGRPGWYSAKTLWFARPEYSGPVFIRGRQLDGGRRIWMGESPAMSDPQLGPGPTVNSAGGWRSWEGSTWLRTPGCYGWQIDGSDFSNVVVIQAVLPDAVLH
jgi:hypothetical protein